MLVLDFGRKDKIDHLAFAPDGRALAAMGQHGIRIWRAIGDGARPQMVNVPRWSRYMRFAEGGKTLLVCSSNLWHVDVPTNIAIEVKKDANRYPLFDVSPDGQFVILSENVFGTPTTNVLSLRPIDNLAWSGALWEQVLPGAYGDRPHYLADGTRFVRLEGGWSAERARNEYHIVTYDATTGKSVAQSPLITRAASYTAAAPDGRWFIGRRDIWVYYWPLTAESGAAGVIKNDNKKHFTDAAFHPSSKYLALTSNDTTVKLYDTVTWEVARAFTWQVGKMRSICFSPDGTLAAAGTDKGQVIVWDVDV
jgi:hypothetical protein